MEVYEKILLPLDGSELSESALPEAEKLAAVSNAKICLIRVVHRSIMGLSDESLLSQAELIREADRYLKDIKNRLEAKGFTAESHVWYGPNAAEEILNHIEFYGTDLIVMATHGRSGLKRLLMGSVTEKVAKNTTNPVVLVRIDPETMDMVDESRECATPA